MDTEWKGEMEEVSENPVYRVLHRDVLRVVVSSGNHAIPIAVPSER
jgi:hypothetical protein